jgi:deazaflavin-dependent oxidoreductase (nitroreductase family)
VASQGGAPSHPVWYHNLKSHPEVEIQDGETKRTYAVRVLSGEERSTWWDRAVAAFPNYADYQKRTDREIPVFVAEPV